VDAEIFLNKVDALAEQAFDDQCTGCNPRYPLISELREIYLAAYKTAALPEAPRTKPVSGPDQTLARR
jgi:hypothetical protein